MLEKLEMILLNFRVSTRLPLLPGALCKMLEKLEMILPNSRVNKYNTFLISFFGSKVMISSSILICRKLFCRKQVGVILTPLTILT